uniref:killer cell lectin-like receptor subfamily B member 1 n=1 Tax=Myodes glareolus TaxID=447135 RepID=UPI002022211D|nr:killer cell lectin-like receptor subfamily B member 1 [Myodes glareolus]
MRARCSVEIVRRNVIRVKGFGRHFIGSDNHEVEAIEMSGTVKLPKKAEMSNLVSGQCNVVDSVCYAIAQYPLSAIDTCMPCYSTVPLIYYRHMYVILQHSTPYLLKTHDVCQCTRWHRLALKLSCAGLILLVLILTGLVGFLVRKAAIEKCGVPAQAIKAEPTGRSAIPPCLKDWQQYGNKCLFISQTSRPWSEGLADCSVRGATLLLIEDQEELRYFQNFSKREGHQFFIGLKYLKVEQMWKWTNGSALNPDQLQVTGKDKDNSCAVISQTEVFSDTCSADNRWVCQKKLEHV